jgi:3-hydroxy-3-methylglutaryl CoA synthase
LESEWSKVVNYKYPNGDFATKKNQKQSISYFDDSKFKLGKKIKQRNEFDFKDYKNLFEKKRGRINEKKLNRKSSGKG